MLRRIAHRQAEGDEVGKQTARAAGRLRDSNPTSPAATVAKQPTAKVIETISDTYGLDVIEPPIPKSIRFAEAPAAGRSILATARKNRGADAYRDVAANLMEKSTARA
jgi:hypothetical protein